MDAYGNGVIDFPEFLTMKDDGTVRADVTDGDGERRWQWGGDPLGISDFRQGFQLIHHRSRTSIYLDNFGEELADAEVDFVDLMSRKLDLDGDGQVSYRVHDHDNFQVIKRLQW